MYSVVKNFLANPWPETFKPIRNNVYLLTRVFREDEDLAKEYFGLAEWSLIEKEVTDLDIREKEFVKNRISDCIEAAKKEDKKAKEKPNKQNH